MATATKNNVDTIRQIGGVPYGNATTYQYTFETDADGIMQDSDLATAIIQGTVVRLGVIPAGFRMDNLVAVISDAFTSSVTHKIGWQYCDGVDVTATPEDDDYFFAALAITAGRTTQNNTASVPVTLPKAAYMILTVNGSTADHTDVGRMDLLLSGVNTGTP